MRDGNEEIEITDATIIGEKPGIKNLCGHFMLKTDLKAVLVLSTEFRTDRPIRTKMAGECENSSILRWQVRLILIRARNGLVTALSTVIWTIFGPQMLSYYIKYF